jgi:hypothetical protein
VWNRKQGSEDNCWKADESGESFLFTLKNRHNVPPKTFPLSPERRNEAIVCDSAWGPYMPGIGISNNCNSGITSVIENGIIYANDTGVDRKLLFTGSDHFQVKEIEVFEITN